MSMLRTEIRVCYKIAAKNQETSGACPNSSIKEEEEVIAMVAEASIEETEAVEEIAEITPTEPPRKPQYSREHAKT